MKKRINKPEIGIVDRVEITSIGKFGTVLAVEPMNPLIDSRLHGDYEYKVRYKKDNGNFEVAMFGAEDLELTSKKPSPIIDIPKGHPLYKGNNK